MEGIKREGKQRMEGREGGRVRLERREDYSNRKRKYV